MQLESPIKITIEAEVDDQGSNTIQVQVAPVQSDNPRYPEALSVVLHAANVLLEQMTAKTKQTKEEPPKAQGDNTPNVVIFPDQLKN